MGKLIGLALIVGLGWVGLEIYNAGLGDAFGGLFSSEKEAEAAAHYISTPQRVGEQVELSLQQDAARTMELLEEQGL